MLDLSHNDIDVDGIKNIANTLQNNIVMEIFYNRFIFVLVVVIFTIGTQNIIYWLESSQRYRHSASSRCIRKEYGKTNFIHLIDIEFNSSSKILTTLNLQKNDIGDTGAQYLANALLHNSVR
jgi:hypothetical protein